MNMTIIIVMSMMNINHKKLIAFSFKNCRNGVLKVNLIKPRGANILELQLEAQDNRVHLKPCKGQYC